LSANHPYTILFVCSGNSCRSPMAEALLRAKLPSHLQDKFVIQSAGTLGIEGMPATDHAIEVEDDRFQVLHVPIRGVTSSHSRLTSG